MKRHWILFFLGISTLLLGSCETDYDGKIEFYIINDTDVDIQAISTNDYGAKEEFAIQAKDTLFNSIYDPWFSEKKPSASQVFSLPSVVLDSITIFFATDKYVSFANQASDCEVPRSMYCIEEYKVEQISERHFRFHYTFTQEDYDNATLIE